jgi:altronate dehydratase
MKPVLVISDRDNVATALESLEAGRCLDVRGAMVTVREAVPAGHKVAISEIAAGQPVVKYGSPIGSATQAIAAGAHVHTHNVASARGRGDLAPRGEAADRAVPRLAEPVDERGDGPEAGHG